MVVTGGRNRATETAREAAVRETREETGYSVVSKSESFTNEYEFLWNGQTYNCRTHWFNGSLATKKPAKVISEADIVAASGFLGQIAEMTLIITSH